MASQTRILTAAQALAFDISSLATSSTFLAGRESAQIDVSSSNYIDLIFNVDPIVGHASTAPTVGQMIALYAWGSDVSLATTAIDVLDGVDSAETLSHASVLYSLAVAQKPAMVTVATAGLSYFFQPFSMRRALGVDVLPNFCGLFLAHNHTGALAASQSAKFSWQGLTYSST